VTRALWASFVTLAVFVAGGLAVALGVGAPDPAAYERVAAAALGGLGLGAGLVALSATVDAGRFPRSRLRGTDELSDAGTAAFATLERSLRFGASAAGDFHAQVRPRLVEVTRACLARRGVSLSDAERATELLGADAYELVDPAGEPPADRFDPGVPLVRVRRLLDRLEILGGQS